MKLDDFVRAIIQAYELGYERGSEDSQLFDELLDENEIEDF